MSGPKASLIGRSDRQLFAAIDGDPASARALLVVCPAWFHEQFLSYRQFAMLCHQLAARGFATLRFDYFGSGDSAGDDRDFSLSGACRDARTAIEHLRALSAAPLLLCGVRAGAWPALRNADLADRVLLWQPLRSGSQWLEQLQAIDAAERTDRLRYPWLAGRPKPAGTDWLVGTACPPGLHNELVAAQWPDPPAMPVDLIDDVAGDAHPDWRFSRRCALPDAIGDWCQRIDMPGRLPTARELRPIVDWIAAAAPAVDR